jgi:tetratricopeptide (TPR) repeat protein
MNVPTHHSGYTNYSPPEYEKVVEDCDEALKLDRTYAKALKRRAAALERLERYEEALRGEQILRGGNGGRS